MAAHGPVHNTEKWTGPASAMTSLCGLQMRPWPPSEANQPPLQNPHPSPALRPHTVLPAWTSLGQQQNPLTGQGGSAILPCTVLQQKAVEQLHKQQVASIGLLSAKPGYLRGQKTWPPGHKITLSINKSTPLVTMDKSQATTSACLNPGFRPPWNNCTNRALPDYCSARQQPTP